MPDISKFCKVLLNWSFVSSAQHVTQDIRQKNWQPSLLFVQRDPSSKPVFSPLFPGPPQLLACLALQLAPAGGADEGILQKRDEKDACGEYDDHFYQFKPEHAGMHSVDD